MMANRDEPHERIWRVAWCLSVRHLINNNTQAGWRLPAMCIIAYTHLIIRPFPHARAYASGRCRAFRSITNVFWDWEHFTIRDSARSNSISQGNKLLEARIRARTWMRERQRFSTRRILRGYTYRRRRDYNRPMWKIATRRELYARWCASWDRRSH